jgi:hypothetical protein
VSIGVLQIQGWEVAATYHEMKLVLWSGRVERRRHSLTSKWTAELDREYQLRAKGVARVLQFTHPRTKGKKVVIRVAIAVIGYRRSEAFARKCMDER